MRIPKLAWRRIMRRGGVKRISTLVYMEWREILTTFLKAVIPAALTYMEYSKRKTLTVRDILMALKLVGMNLYGFR